MAGPGMRRGPGGPHGMMPGEKAQDFKGTMKKLLAYLGRTEIAESLSQVALTEIIGVVLAYAIKSLVENLSKNNNWPDKARKDETTHE